MNSIPSSKSKRTSDPINAGRELAYFICTTSNGALYLKIHKAIRKFIQFIYKLISQYASYLFDTHHKAFSDFISYKIGQYIKELKPSISFEGIDDVTKKELFIKVTLLDNLMPNENSSEHTQKSHSQSTGQCGQNIRSIENLRRIVHGDNDSDDPVNIREMLSMIYNFRFSCALMWDVIKLYYQNNLMWENYFGKVFHTASFKKHLARMSSYLEMDMKDVVGICHKLVTENSNTRRHKSINISKCFQNHPGVTLSLCALVYLPVSGQVLTSRVCPEGACRQTPTDKCIKKPLFVQHIKPDLSTHEKEFMMRFDRVTSEALSKDDTEVKWMYGKSCYDPLKESFFYSFYDILNKPLITGPSGTMDMFMTFASYFPLSVYEKQLIILGIIAWMAIPPDHSVFEMLSVIPAHKLIDYKPSDDEYIYVKNMANHLTTSDSPFKTMQPIKAKQSTSYRSTGPSPKTFARTFEKSEHVKSVPHAFSAPHALFTRRTLYARPSSYTRH